MRICVFCGSSFGQRQSYVEAARELGKEIAGRGFGLVYGGAKVGLMGVVAEAALTAGAEVIGVMPKALSGIEIDYPDITELHIVGSMHERKAMMADLSDAFAVLPGGLGTLEEAFEVWTWAQLGFHSKPIGLVNTDHYYDKLEGFLDQTVSEGFVKDVHRNMVVSETSPSALLDKLLQAQVPTEAKWVDPID